jgi:hypothetical protein
LPYLWLFKKRNTKTTTTTKKRNNKTLDLRAKTTLFINRFFFGILNDEKLCSLYYPGKKNFGMKWTNATWCKGKKQPSVISYSCQKRERKIPTY